MALDYTVYYKKSKEELRVIVNSFVSKEDIKAFFIDYSIHDVTPLKNEILNEMGYDGKYISRIFFTLNKLYAVEATNTLKILRDNYLGKENSVFLLNGDTELLP